MSVDGIAREAGVGKPTIYRRWPDKAHLASAALALLQADEPVSDTGDARADFTGLLRNFQRSLLRPNGMAMLGTVLAEEPHHPELIALLRERVVGPRRRMLRRVLDSAVAAGQVRADADLDAAVAMTVGSLYARYLAGDGIEDDWPERIVAVVWTGIAVADQRAGQAASSHCS